MESLMKHRALPKRILYRHAPFGSFMNAAEELGLIRSEAHQANGKQGRMVLFTAVPQGLN